MGTVTSEAPYGGGGMTLRAALAASVAVSLLVLPCAVEAQPIGRLLTVGILANEAWPPIDAFRQGLRALGYVEGQHVRFEYRYAEGHNDRFPGLAKELVAMRVDAIVTWGTDAALAAKNATKTIPIVMGAIGDPIAAGAVESLAHPGGNITGLSALAGELEGKRLELLAEILPTLSHVAVIVNPTNRYNARSALPHARRGAVTLKLTLKVVEVHDAKTLSDAFALLTREPPQAILVLADPFVASQRQQLAEFALRARLPTAHTYREHVEAGGLVAYSPNYSDLFRRAAGYFNKIVHGAKPGDLPIEQPTKFDVILNLRTAKTLGLTIPQSLLLRADQIIE